MKSILTELYDLVCETMTRLTWDFRGALWSYEFHKIRSHEEDYKKYLAACDLIRETKQPVTIILHTGEKLTLL